MYKYPYTILLAISLFVASIMYVGNGITNFVERAVAAQLSSGDGSETEEAETGKPTEPVSEAAEEPEGTETLESEEESAISESEAEIAALDPGNEAAASESESETVTSDSEAEASVSDPEASVSDPEVPFTLDDALFVGDSRIVGLFEYADLGQAEYFADRGMSVYKIMGARLTMPDGEKHSLEEVLSSKAYGKVYVMLGVNELGYDLERTAEKYQDLLNFIEIWQPGAKIILMANMHVSEEKSASDSVYNNERINQLNGYLQALLTEDHQYYLDINELFDDETGSLASECTGDGIHLKGQYFIQWADWLRENEI